MEIAKTLGGVIRSDRKARGLNLTQLAEKLGIGVATLHRIEVDETSPSLNLLREIALELQQPMLVFFQHQVKGNGMTKVYELTKDVAGSQKDEFNYVGHTDAQDERYVEAAS